MTNDRELLNLAAKAAGIEFLDWRDSWSDYSGPAWRTVNRELWNPLTDDGDALRLAVELNISISRPVVGDSHYGTYAVSHDQTVDLREPDKGNPYAATRLAIVRAAAAIGESMPATQGGNND
jgi:hypothetical protein